jgi:hypothetical protein
MNQQLIRQPGAKVNMPDGAIRYFPQKSLPDIVGELLLLDFRISDEGSIALMEMFRQAYEAATAAP